MPSSYTTSLRLTLPATGELSGQWGTTVNTGITELLDSAVAGTAAISTWGGAGVAYTLSNNSGLADEARKIFIVATGSPGEAKNVICPAVSKFYVFRNDTAGGFALTLKTSGGTGISVPAGQYKFLYCNGTDVVEMFNSAGALTLSGALSVGGTTTLASNPTLSAGTANQVQYLNASKVLVGSANLTFDGTTLTAANFADSSLTNTRVVYAGASGNLTDSANFTFNGTDLTVSGAVNAGSVNATTLDLTNIEVTNVKAKDGTSAATIADSTGVVSFTANPVISGGTANGVTYLNASKVLTSGSALTFDGTTLVSGTGIRANSFMEIRSNTAAMYWENAANTLYWSQILTGSDFAWNYFNGGSPTEQMRLTSTGLGIGTSSPQSRFEARQDQLGAITRVIANNNNATAGSGSSFDYYLATTRLGGLTHAFDAVSAYLAFDVWSGSAATERMRLDSSGNLGIGASSPAYKLDVNGNAQVGNATAATNRFLYVNGVVSKASAIAFQESGVNRWLIGNGAASENGNFEIYDATNGNNFILTRSGNLGLGVTPSAWVDRTALEGSYGGALSFDKVYLQTALSSNCNYNGTNWLYKLSGWGATRYELGDISNGSAFHKWYTAPSGTAGNAISFTQAMTLDASGNLGVGETSLTARFTVKTSNAFASYIVGPANVYSDLTDGTGTLRMQILSNESNIGSASNHALVFKTNNTERARITSGGDLLVGTTSTTPNPGVVVGPSGFISTGNNAGSSGFVFQYFGRNGSTIGTITQDGTTAVLYNTTSDRRLKENIIPAPSASDVIDAIQIVSHDWKSAPDEHVTYGVIAQDLHTVAPQAVLQGDDGDEIEKAWGVDYSKLVPMLIKEIQSLRARLAAAGI